MSFKEIGEILAEETKIGAQEASVDKTRKVAAKKLLQLLEMTGVLQEGQATNPASQRVVEALLPVLAIGVTTMAPDSIPQSALIQKGAAMAHRGVVREGVSDIFPMIEGIFADFANLAKSAIQEDEGTQALLSTFAKEQEGPVRSPFASNAD